MPALRGSGKDDFRESRSGRGRLRLDLVFPRFKLLSGAERAILAFARELDGLGHRPRIVCHRFDDSCRPPLAPGVELVVTGRRLDWSRNRYVNALFDYVRTLQLRHALDPTADARVFFGGPAVPLAYVMRARRRDPAPAIYYCYEPPRALYQDRADVLRRLGALRWPIGLALWLYRRIDRHMVRAVDAVASNSRFSARRARACYGRPATLVGSGIDTDSLDRGLREVGPLPCLAEIPEDAPLFVSVNYLHPRKRIDLLLDAFAAVSEQRSDAWLLVVGDGPERRRLEERAAELGVSGRVRFAGFVDEAVLARAYAAATCYVHTARQESFGLSVVEASYSRLPVVTVDEGGPRETVLDGVTGYRVVAEPGALADAMARVLGAPDRGAAMGRRGREVVASRYRWRDAAQRLVVLARSLRARTGGAPAGRGGQGGRDRGRTG